MSGRYFKGEPTVWLTLLQPAVPSQRRPVHHKESPVSSQRSLLALPLLLIGLLAARPSAAEAQTAPPGAIPACENARYLELKAIAYQDRTPEQATEFEPLHRACSQGLIAYYQYTAAMSARRFDLREDQFSDREPAEAMLWSFVVPGGGQFYNRQPGKGAFFLIANVVGWYTFFEASKDGEVFGSYRGDDERQTIRNAATGLIIGSYLGSLFDAVRSAR
jgi:hypothetical protein